MNADPYAHERYDDEAPDDCPSCRVKQLEIDALKSRLARTECDHCHHPLPVSARCMRGQQFCSVACGLQFMAAERDVEAIFARVTP